MEVIIIILIVFYLLYVILIDTNYQSTQTPYFYLKEITWLKACETGWGNGYIVILDKTHPLFGQSENGTCDENGNYDWDSKLDKLKVHGGITYSDYHEDKKGWVIGFDCAHFGDNPRKHNKEWLFKHTQQLLE
jgi:hypothetical protein